jgi:hypothetical protein
MKLFTSTLDKNLAIAMVAMFAYVLAMVVFDLPWETMVPFMFGAALAADRDTPYKDGQVRGYPVLNNTTIFKGAMVALTDAGYLVPASDTAALRVVGVSQEKVISPSTDAAGAKKCRVISGKSFLFNATSITQAMLGDVMHVVDDNTFDDAVGTNTVPCGKLVEFVSTTSGYIYIAEGTLRKAGVAAAADLIS